MIRSVNFNSETFSKLEDLIALAHPGKKNHTSKYISGLINEEYDFIKPPKHDTNLNGVQEQPEPEEAKPAEGVGEQNDLTGTSDQSLAE